MSKTVVSMRYKGHVYPKTIL